METYQHLIQIISDDAITLAMLKTFLNQLEEKASLGDDKAQNCLGILHYKGFPSSNNKDLSESMLSTIYNLTDNSELISRDLKKAVYWLKKAVDNNNADAKYLLAKMYALETEMEKKSDQEKNYDEAIKLLISSVKQEHKPSKYALAGQFYDKVFRLKDYKERKYYYNEAVDLLLVCAEEGKYISYVKLAKLQEFQGDYYGAFSSYHEAAKHGLSFAKFKLGEMYKNGKGVKQNIEVALQWYEHVAKISKDNVCIQATRELGLLYIDTAPQRAFELLSLASKQGDSIANHTLGLMLLKDSESSTPDEATTLIQEGMSMLFSAANNNYAPSLNMLGQYFYKGFLLKYSLEKATEYFSRAEKLGHAEGTKNLGWIYFHHYPVEKKEEYLQLSIKFYEKAARKGNSDAAWLLSDYFMSWDIKRAIYYVEHFAEEGDIKMQEQLSRLYGILGDFKESEFWLLKSIKGGNKKAEKELKAGSLFLNEEIITPVSLIK